MWFHPTLDGMVASLEEAHQIIVAQSDTIATLQARIEIVDAALKTALATIEKQQYQLEQYIKRLSGHRSEKYCPDQILFDPILLQSLPDPAAAVAPEPVEEPSESEPRQRKKRSRHGRLPIPDHLERVVIELDIEPDDRICPHTDKPMVLIGCEETEKLEYQPGRLLVNVYRRPKYASPDRIGGNSVGVLTAPMPDHPIPKCKADCGLIAYAIVSKFADHLPFYRQDAIFEREGVRIARSDAGRLGPGHGRRLTAARRGTEKSGAGYRRIVHRRFGHSTHRARPGQDAKGAPLGLHPRRARPAPMRS